MHTSLPAKLQWWVDTDWDPGYLGKELWKMALLLSKGDIHLEDINTTSSQCRCESKVFKESWGWVGSNLLPKVTYKWAHFIDIIGHNLLHHQNRNFFLLVCRNSEAIPYYVPFQNFIRLNTALLRWYLAIPVPWLSPLREDKNTDTRSSNWAYESSFVAQKIRWNEWPVTMYFFPETPYYIFLLYSDMLNTLELQISWEVKEQ